MKRKLFSALVVLILCLSLVISVSAAGADCIYDDAGLLSYEDEMELRRELERIGDKYEAQIVVVTLESAEGYYIDSLVDDIYDGMDFGYGSARDGVLLLICMDIREYRILGNGFAAEAIDADVIDSICDKIEPDLRDGDYEDAFEEFAEQCEYYLNGYINGFPFEWGMNLVIALGIGIVIGLIVVFVMKGQLKSVHKQERANDYVKAGSMNVRIRNDFFLYKKVTRTKKASSSSSGSSGGSSRSKGGGSF